MSRARLAALVGYAIVVALGAGTASGAGPDRLIIAIQNPGSLRYEIHEANLATSRCSRLYALPPSAGESLPWIEPDGRHFTFTDYGSSGGQRIGRIDGRRVTISATDATHIWSSDGRQRVLVSSHDGRLEVADSRGRALAAVTVTGDPSPVEFGPFALSADGRRLAYGLSRGRNTSGSPMRVTLEVLPLDGSPGRTVFREQPAPQNVVPAPLWSPDGSSMVFTRDRNGMSVLVRLDPKTLRTSRLAPRLDVHDPIWSPDGRIAFRGGEPRQPPTLYIMRADGSGLRRLRDDSPDQLLAWSPRSDRLAYASEGRLVVSAADGSRRRALCGSPRRPVVGAAWVR